MAKLNLDFYQNDSGYSDGSIETRLFEGFEAGLSEKEMIEREPTWEGYYHLNPCRQNILRWYPFKENASVLEIGSGMGGLTGLLCEKAKWVTSIELTKERAQVNWSRNKDRENLEIIVGNFNNIELEEKYDYVLLNGVLEYAGSFTQTEGDPYEAFLRYVKSFLKEDGILLISIENRLGMKYLNGAPEDHTARLFSGINDYVNIDSVRTFTRSELKALLRRVGLIHQNFRYPEPDYKFTSEVFSDESQDLVSSSFDDIPFNTNRLVFFNDKRFMRDLQNEGVASSFFNSFFVEASTQKIETRGDEILYVKMPLFRQDRFSVMTEIIKGEDRIYVKKSPIYPQAEEHLQRMYDFYQLKQDKSWYTLASTYLEGKELIFDFIEGETLEKVLIQDLLKGDFRSFEKRIKDFTKNVRSGGVEQTEWNEDFLTVFGEYPDRPYLCHKNEDIDLIFSNIILGVDKPIVIDYEWSFPFYIPDEYVIWRSIFYLYIQHPEVSARFSFKELYKIADLKEEDTDLFLRWDNHFTKNYVDDHLSLQNNIRCRINVDKLLSEQLSWVNPISTLYFDYGEGYRTEDSISTPLQLNGNSFTVKFDLREIRKKHEHQRLLGFRWDPSETPIRIHNLHYEGPVDVYFDPQHAIVQDGWINFFQNDPQILITGEFADTDFLVLKGKCSADLVEYIDLVKSYAELYKIEQHTNQELYKQVESLERELKILLNSDSWKVTKPVRKLGELIRKIR